MKNKIEQLIGQPENQHLEYKIVLPPPPVIARNLAAFANSGGGVLIIGIGDEDLSIEGIADDVPAPSIVEAALARLNPRPRVKHYFIDVNVGSEIRKLYVIEVEVSSNVVVTENQSIFTRVNNLIRQASAKEIVGIAKQLKLKTSKIPQTLDRINQKWSNSTEANQRFLEQYKNLLSIAQQSIGILCTEEPNLPTRISEGRTLTQLLFSSLIDTLEIYFADLLLEIYLAQPNTLKTESTVTVKEVLNCENMAEFIKFVADKRIQKLNKGDVEGFVKSFKSSTSFDIFLETEMSKVEYFFQIRHLYTHSNGRIDTPFLNKTGVSNFRLGDEHQISINEFCEIADFFLNIVNRLDAEAIAKYKLTISS